MFVDQVYGDAGELRKILNTDKLIFCLCLVPSYFLKYGNTDVPDARSGELQTIGRWVQRQRFAYTTKEIDPARELLLKLIGFNFRVGPFPLDWDTMFNKVQKFYKEFGHTRITASKDKQLFRWLSAQKQLYWAGKLKAGKFNKLISIGVNMENQRLNIWDKRFEQLVKFKKKHGHLHVCRYYTEDQQLIYFSNDLRRLNNRKQLSEERIQRLNAIEFPWNPGKDAQVMVNWDKTDTNWLKHYAELKAFKEKYGHFRVQGKEYPTLSKWVYRQRHLNLPEKRRSLLEKLGFFDNP